MKLSKDLFDIVQLFAKPSRLDMDKFTYIFAVIYEAQVGFRVDQCLFAWDAAKTRVKGSVRSVAAMDI